MNGTDGRYPVPAQGVFGMPGQRLDQMGRNGAGAPSLPVDVSKSRARPEVVYGDLPLVTIQNTWSVPQARQALASHMQGIFESSSQLWESILGDDRVAATLGSRVTGLLGREVRFKHVDSDAGRECGRAWEACWPLIAGDSSIGQISKTTIGLGIGAAQILWDTTKPVWCPYLRPWHLRFSYYDWTLRRLIALSQDGPIVIEPGDSKWLVHAPNGDYRGWIYGAIRAVTEPWMLRHFAFRDMARFSEIHGLPTRVGKVPAVANAEERAYFEQQIAQVGSNTSMLLPQGVDGPTGGYDYSLVEARDTAWESFPGLIDRCDMAIVLALLFQNLTTEVKGGSFAATSAHMDIRQSGLQGDSAAWRNTIYTQLARPFAYLNFGDADLAPTTWWDVEPRADIEGNAHLFQQFGTAIEVLARGGLKFKDVEELRKFAARKFGLDGLPDFEIGDPIAGGLGGGKETSKLPFTPLDPAAVVTVDEARALNDLPPISGGDGSQTIAEYNSKKTAKPVQSAKGSSPSSDDEEGDK